MFRPPWDYDLMSVLPWLSLAISAVLLAGIGCAIRQCWRGRGGDSTADQNGIKESARGCGRESTADQNEIKECPLPSDVWALLVGTVFLYLLAMLYMSLKVPSYAQTKAFYGFPALLPFTALFALGWQWLAQRHRLVPWLLGGLVLAWAINDCAAFWIRSDNPGVARDRGEYQLLLQRPNLAVQDFLAAVQADPRDADAQCVLAETYQGLNDAPQAVRHFREALRLRPQFPEAQNSLAIILALVPDPRLRDPAAAVKLATDACTLTRYAATKFVITLAVSQAAAGQFEQARATLRLAAELAARRDEPRWIAQCQQLAPQFDGQHPFPAPDAATPTK
jgi:tetratricopeptide (TPR) repeat protein